jgi:hypothetical protein
MFRAFPLLRAGYAAVLLATPSLVIGICTGQPASKLDRRVARVLGVRHLTQAILTARAPKAAVFGVGAAVDVAHAASMLALAASDHPMRRAEITDGLIAAGFAAAGTALTATSNHRS